MNATEAGCTMGVFPQCPKEEKPALYQCHDCPGLKTFKHKPSLHRHQREKHDSLFKCSEDRAVDESSEIPEGGRILVPPLIPPVAHDPHLVHTEPEVTTKYKDSSSAPRFSEEDKAVLARYGNAHNGFPWIHSCPFTQSKDDAPYPCTLVRVNTIPDLLNLPLPGWTDSYSDAALGGGS